MLTSSSNWRIFKPWVSQPTSVCPHHGCHNINTCLAPVVAPARKISLGETWLKINFLKPDLLCIYIYNIYYTYIHWHPVFFCTPHLRRLMWVLPLFPRPFEAARCSSFPSRKHRVHWPQALPSSRVGGLVREPTDLRNTDTELPM